MASESVPDIPEFSAEEKQIKPLDSGLLEYPLPIDGCAAIPQRGEHKAGPETNSCALRVWRFLAHWANRLGLLGPTGVFLGIIAFTLFGALIFYRTTESSISYGDAIYWAVVTSTTVGYGNIVPHGTAAKSFVIIYICLSITVLLAAVSFLHEYIIEKAKRMKKQYKLPTPRAILRETVISLGVALIFIIVGAVFFAFNEGFSWLDSFFFVISTLSTVGYGVIVPQKQSSIAFLTCFILVGVPVFAARLNSLLQAVNEYLEVRRDQKMLAKGVTVAMIEAADKDGNGSVDRAEFTLYYLETMGKVQQVDIEQVHLLFDAYDISGDGQLTAEDVQTAVPKHSKTD